MPKLSELKEIPHDEAIDAWVRHQRTSKANACVRYAMAFNTLDLTWLDGALSPFVTYESQSVLNKLSGRQQTLTFLTGKCKTFLRHPHNLPRFELARTRRGEPCLAVFQPQGPLDRNWLEEPISNVVFDVDGLGQICSIFFITVAPPPATVVRSGLYPGVADLVRERPRAFIRPASDYRGLCFKFFLVNGRYAQDLRMKETAVHVEANFPGAQCRVVVIEDLNNEEQDRELGRTQFVGFPSVAVFWRESIVYRHQGFIAAQALSAAIREAARLHVVGP